MKTTIEIEDFDNTEKSLAVILNELAVKMGDATVNGLYRGEGWQALVKDVRAPVAPYVVRAASAASGEPEVDRGADLWALLNAYREACNRPVSSANYITRMSEAFDVWMRTVTDRLEQRAALSGRTGGGDGE